MADIIPEVQNWKVISDITLSAPQQNIDFTGLNVNSHGMYVLFVSITNNEVPLAAYHFYINGDFVDLNYYERITEDAFDAGIFNDAFFAQCNTGEDVNHTIYIKRGSAGRGIMIFSGQEVLAGVGNITNILGTLVTSGVLANITSIRIHSTIVNGLGINSRFILSQVK